MEITKFPVSNKQNTKAFADKPPLRITKVISRICQFLDYSSLKAVRTLNSVWLRESRPHFLALAQTTLLPSAADDPTKWNARLSDYEARVGAWGHANFSINTNAYSVSTQGFNYEEQMIKFASRHGSQIKKLNLTVKLKTKENFVFFLTFLKALEAGGNGVLTNLSLCLGITRSNYTQEDLGPLEGLPILNSVTVLSLSVPPGNHWALPSINMDVAGRPSWEPREDFAGKVLTMFPNIEDLKLGEDCQTLSLNLEYVAILAQIRGVKNTNQNAKDSAGDTNPEPISASSTTPLLVSDPTSSPPSFSIVPPLTSDYFANLKSLDLLISHSHILTHLLTLDLCLEKLHLRLGIQVNTPPTWEGVTTVLESLLDKHAPTLVHLSLEQRAQPDWNIWRISLPLCPTLRGIQVVSTDAVPTGLPQPVEETRGRIRLQDLFRMGVTSLEETFPVLNRVSFNYKDGIYTREVFDRVFPQEGVAAFPQIRRITLPLPNENESSSLGEFSLCEQRLRNIFPNADNLLKNYTIPKIV